MSKTQNEDVTRHHGYPRIRANINYLLELPAPEEGWWLARDQSQGVQAKIRALLQSGIIERGERLDDRYGRHYHRTDPKAYRDVQDYIESMDTLPCGHVGLDNHSGGYGCGYEYCDEVFCRGVVEDALGVE